MVIAGGIRIWEDFSETFKSEIRIEIKAKVKTIKKPLAAANDCD
jgi:hypothetical protein